MKYQYLRLIRLPLKQWIFESSNNYYVNSSYGVDYFWKNIPLLCRKSGVKNPIYSLFLLVISQKHIKYQPKWGRDFTVFLIRAINYCLLWGRIISHFYCRGSVTDFYTWSRLKVCQVVCYRLYARLTAKAKSLFPYRYPMCYYWYLSLREGWIFEKYPI